MRNLIVQNSRLVKRLTVLLSVVVIMFLGFYIVHLERKFEDISSLLRDRLVLVEDIERRLGELNADVGYAGFIHNFKNYVLRREDVYRLKAIANYENALSHMSALRGILITQEDFQALDQIEAVLGRYKENLEKLPRTLVFSRIEQDDALVKVDDRPAVKAFDSLYQSVGEQTQRVLQEVRGKEADVSAYIRLGYWNDGFYLATC